MSYHFNGILAIDRYSSSNPQGAVVSIIADTESDLPSVATVATDWLVTMIIGSQGKAVDTGADYLLDSNGTWVKQPGQIFENTYTKSEVDSLLAGKEDTLTFDTIPTENSTNPVESGGIWSPLAELVNNGAKNIANWTASTSTINNVKFTVSGDTITVTLISGTTATARSQKGLSVRFRSDLPSGTYVLSGAPALTAGGLYLWDQTTSSRVTPISDMGSGTVFTFNYDPTHTYNITVDIANGYKIPTGTSLVFKPMICSKVQWDISQTYEPYSMTYPELTESKIGSLDVFGVGTAITENTDLNNLRTPGVYYCINATIAATLIHSPVSQSFRLLVTNTNTNARYDQIIFARDAASIYRRSDTGGGFGHWFLFSGTDTGS